MLVSIISAGDVIYDICPGVGGVSLGLAKHVGKEGAVYVMQGDSDSDSDSDQDMRDAVVETARLNADVNVSCLNADVNVSCLNADVNMKRLGDTKE